MWELGNIEGNMVATRTREIRKEIEVEGFFYLWLSGGLRRFEDRYLQLDASASVFEVA